MSREYFDKGAVIEGDYRYVLWRRWGERFERPSPLTAVGGRVLWVMLNPSTADGLTDDATVRKVVGFTDLWGAVEARIVNTCALRSRHPKELLVHPEPVGPRNDEFIMAECRAADAIVLAWGGNADRRSSPVHTRAVAVWRSIINDEELMNGGTPIWHLGLTKGGQPLHPLMLGYHTIRKNTDVGDLPNDTLGA